MPHETALQAQSRSRKQTEPGDAAIAAGLVFLVGLGALLRLLQYLRNYSLWGDEAMLALSIASRSFLGLLHPLDYGQVAPIPFLWVERLAVTTFGPNEPALRAFPLIAGIGVCLLTALGARRLLRPGEAIAAAALVAVSQPLIRYSAEVKPYMVDALFAVALVLTAAQLLERFESRTAWAKLTLVGVATVLFSLTAPFGCGAVAIALAFDAIRRRRIGQLGRVGIITGVWAILYGLTYIWFYRPAASGDYMRQFWKGAMLLPGTANLVAKSRLAVQEMLWGVDSGAAVLGISLFTIVLLAVGVWRLLRRDQLPLAILLAAPAMGAFGASLLGRYPVVLRLVLFIAPLLILLAAVGLVGVGETVATLLPKLRARWVVALLLLPGITITLAWQLLNEQDEQVRPLVEELRGRWQPGDAVYVFHRVIPAWLFYSTDWNAPDSSLLRWAVTVSGPGGPAHENGPSRGARPMGEGGDLTYRMDGRAILLGTATGIQFRPMLGYRPRSPDAGWSENETWRMAQVAGPRLWLLLGNTTHNGLSEGRELLQGAARSGGRLISHRSLGRTDLYLFAR
jgi:hypothetical protein